MGLLATALIVRLTAWKLFPNVHAADEVFQYQEPAYRLLEGYGVVTWEYIEGVRSWAVPGLLAVLLWVSKLVFGGVAAWNEVVAFALSMLSLTVVWAMAEHGRLLWGLRGAVLAGGIGVVWYELVYFAPKTLTSPIATHLMVAAVLLWGLGTRRVSKARLIAGGLLVSAAFVVRPQLAAGLAVLTLGLIWGPEWRHTARFALAGCVGGLAAAGLLDLLAFDYPFQWLFETYRFQIELGVFDSFGVEPWNWYLRWLIQSWSFVAPVLLGLFVVGFRRLPALGATAITIGATYSLFGHKEYRFIFPVIVLVLIVASAGLVQLMMRLESAKAPRWSAWVSVGVIVALTALVGVERSFSDLEPGWTRNIQTIQAFETLRDEPGVESILLDGVRWTSTPGYTVLQRAVPLRVLVDGERIDDLAGTYTHVLTLKDASAMPPDHELIDSWVVGDSIDLNLFGSGSQYTGPPAVNLNDQIASQWKRFRDDGAGSIAPP